MSHVSSITIESPNSTTIPITQHSQHISVYVGDNMSTIVKNLKILSPKYKRNPGKSLVIT